MNNKTHYNWIEQKLDENNYETKKVYVLFNEFSKEFPSVYANSESFNRAVRICKSRLISDTEVQDTQNIDSLFIEKPIKEMNFNEYKVESINDLIERGIDIDIIKQNVKLQKRVQYRDDTNREERKAFRNQARLDNTLEEMTQHLIDILENKFDLSINNDDIKTIEANNCKAVGLIQLSDLHLNELVNAVYKNTYDFRTASVRLKMYVDEAKNIFKGYGITDVTIAMTGDIFNNNAISDKKMNQEYNRMYSLVIACYLLENVILDLSNDFRVSVASVVGNESRTSEQKEIAYSNKLVTENFDFTLHKVLKMLFRKVKNVTFYDGRFDEKVIRLLNSNILMLHGHTLSTTDYHKNMQNIVGKYSALGIEVNYVICGHIHSAHISDTFSRSSSLVGSNNYSNNALQLYGRASQNIYVIQENKNINAFKIDLQNISINEGYPLNEELLKEIESEFVKVEDILIEIY